MIRTLRITSFLLAAVALCGVVVLVVLGLKGDPEILAFLGKEGVVSKMKNQAQAAPQKEDAASPLVTQAQKFALRIDPPPPPVPVTPPAPSQPRPQQPVTPPPVTPVAPPVVTPPQSTGRYTLLATARYAEFPDRSLALFKPVVGPAKWHRQGESLGHLNIHEIRDGSVVLYQAGRMNSELFVPKPVARGKSLLKSDTPAAAGPSPAVAATQGPVSPPTDAAAEAADAGRAVRVTRTSPPRTVDAAARVQRVVTPPREPTREEQRDSIQQSIVSIGEIMNRSEGYVSEDEQRKEQEAWMELLKVLQQEKAALEPGGAAEAGTAEQAEQAEQDDSEKSPEAEASGTSDGD